MPAKKRVPLKSMIHRRLRKNRVMKKPTSDRKSGAVNEDLAEKEINSFSEYISVIEKYCDTDFILFRGQNSDWPLLPKLCRLKLREGSILDTESSMLEDFKRLSKPHLTKFPSNNWEWIALAQHHGVPTRLLDWSMNPLAALWFAVSQPCCTEYGVVWIFFLEKKLFLTPNQLHSLDPFKEKAAKVFQPEISTIRIQSQSGWFTTQQFQDAKNFVAFNEVAKYKRRLMKLTIPKVAFSSLRFQLDRLGVNRFSLFQDLDGIASYVEWQHTVGVDEEHSNKGVKRV